jgi:hypothetical protein
MLKTLYSRFPKWMGVLDRLTQSKVNQEPIDIYNATTAILCYNQIKKSPNQEITNDDGIVFLDTADRMNRQERNEYVQVNCTQQLQSMFQTMFELEQEYSMDMKSICHAISSPSNNTTAGNSSSAPRIATDYDVYKHRLARLANKKETTAPMIKLPLDSSTLVKRIGFDLRVLPSSIAGNGVFIRASDPVPPGTLIGLFSGDIHLLEYATSSYLTSQKLLPDDDFMMTVR